MIDIAAREGRISLGAAFLGLASPLFFVLADGLLFDSWFRIEWPFTYRLCWLDLVAWEVVALVYGVRGEGSAAADVGCYVACFALVLAILLDLASLAPRLPARPSTPTRANPLPPGMQYWKPQ